MPGLEPTWGREGVEHNARPPLRVRQRLRKFGGSGGHCCHCPNAAQVGALLHTASSAYYLCAGGGRNLYGCQAQAACMHQCPSDSGDF